MNIVDAIRIQHFKAESQQRRISSIFFFKTAQDIFNNKMTCTLGLLFVMLTMWIGNIFLSPIFYNAVQDIFNNKMRGIFVYSLLCSPCSNCARYFLSWTTVWGAFFVYSLLCSPGGLAISFYLPSFSKLCKIFSTTRWGEVLFTLCYAHIVQTVQDIFYPEQQYEVHSLFTLCYAHQVGWQYLHCTTENNKPGQTPFNTGSKANTAEMQQQKKE